MSFISMSDTASNFHLDSDSSSQSDAVASSAMMLDISDRNEDGQNGAVDPKAKANTSFEEKSKFPARWENFVLNKPPKGGGPEKKNGMQEAFQVLNAKCFEAAIREKVVDIKHPFALKMKSSKKSFHHFGHAHSIGKTWHHQQTSSLSLASDTITKRNQNLLILALPPKLTGSGSSPEEVQTNLQQQASILIPQSDQDLRKCRYNQTSLVLEQSGLMKTTVKTAELLRKSRIIQQELNKLRNETGIFINSVLNNPQNQHLKEQLVKSKKYSLGPRK